MVNLQRVDVHLHTWFSDGSLPPKKVVIYSKKAGKLAIAITDHDTIKGTSEAIQITPSTDWTVL